MSILNISLLKSIPQARYSEKNIGHFGLRTKNYLHFTSPIRRYADLIVHRIIKSILSKSNKTVIEHKFTKDKKQIQNIAIHCSNKERKIIELERKIDALHNTWFMRKKIGTKANGIVTSCTDFGAFVRLNEYHVEGLVHINKINKGFLEYNPSNMRLTNKQSNFSIGVGDKVVVKLTSINIKKCHIDLKLI